MPIATDLLGGVTSRAINFTLDGAVTGDATIEPGDTELTIPTILQPVAISGVTGLQNALDTKPEIVSDISTYNGTPNLILFDKSVWQSDGTTGHTGAEEVDFVRLVSSDGRLFVRTDNGVDIGAGLAVRAYWYGLREGNTAAENNLALAAAISSGAPEVIIEAGTFLISSLILPSGTQLRGAGKHKTILKADLSLASNAQLVRNQTHGTYTDENIALRDMTFDFNNLDNGATQTRLVAFIGLNRITGLILENVRVTNGGYIGVSTGSSIDVKIEDCDFDKLGYVNHSVNAGPAVWATSSGGDLPERLRVINCDFIDNEWHGIHIGGRGVTIDNCNFIRNKETNIYGSMVWDGSQWSTGCFDVDIKDSDFKETRRKDISGHGIEIEAHGLLISGNNFEDIDHGAVAMSQCQDARIVNNNVKNVGQFGAVGWGGFDIISNVKTAQRFTRGITITGNRVYDDQAVPTTRHGARTHGTQKIESVEIYGNDFSYSGYTEKPFETTNAVWDMATCRYYDNRDASSGVYSETVDITASGALPFNTCPFPPRKITILAQDQGAEDGFSRCVLTTNDSQMRQVFHGNGRSSATTNTLWRYVDASNVQEDVATLVGVSVDGFTASVTNVNGLKIQVDYEG